MNFFKDPKYKSIRIVLLLVIIVGAGWFTYSNMQLSNSNQGRVINRIEQKVPASSGLLSVGATGENVRLLQEALINKGFFTGKVDGVFDKSTQRALISYQKAEKLPATGTVNLTYDDTIFKSLAEEKAYEEYALTEIQAYRQKNNISPDDFVVREGTEGQLVPSSKFTVVPSEDVTYSKPSNAIKGGDIVQLGVIRGSSFAAVFKNASTSTVVDNGHNETYHKRWWGWRTTVYKK
jgi:peptidoglycan hydrolase-like protein with peptidoglycan-binding domain